MIKSSECLIPTLCNLVIKIVSNCVFESPTLGVIATMLYRVQIWKLTVILTLHFSNLYLHALLSQQLCQSLLIHTLNKAKVTIIHHILHDTPHSACHVRVRYLVQASYLCQYREISVLVEWVQLF